MDLDEQEAIRRVVDRHGSEVVVVLGQPNAESTQLIAETVMRGDPSYAGPLAGVPLGLEVCHILEPEVKAQVDAGVFEEEVGPLEMVLDTPAILEAMSSTRAA